MNKLPLVIIVTILMMVLTLVLSGCITINPTPKLENSSENNLEDNSKSNLESEVNNISRFIMYNPDLTIFDSIFIDRGYYYIVDTYTDNVYVQKTSSSHVGIFPLYDENGNITKAKDMGITY